ncbi:MAG: hypothetical protein AB4060_10640 [Crocosphaera sp.]
MNKYKYTKATVSNKKKDEGMSLLALLFFMMGAVNVYGHLQVSNNQVTTTNDNELNGLFKVGIFTMVLASVIELFIF